MGSARLKNNRFEAECSRSRPNGVLPFARSDAKRRREDRVHVGVLHDERSAREVRIEIELEAPREPAPQIRTQAAEGEGVDDLLVRIVERESAVCVDQQPDLQTEVAVAPTGGRTRPAQRRPAAGPVASQWAPVRVGLAPAFGRRSLVWRRSSGHPDPLQTPRRPRRHPSENG